jgi:membrane-bound lytic murein transglycosylase B
MLKRKSLMRIGYPLIAASMIFMFLACAERSDQIKISRQIKVDSNIDYVSPETRTPVKISSIPESGNYQEPDVLTKTGELKQELVLNGVPEEWFDEQLQHETFKIHATIGRYFQKSAERQVDHNKERDASWYFTRLGVGSKIKKGKSFIKAHRDILKQAEARHGVHLELIAAVIGIETNFANQHQRGKFYAFNSLVSQYIFTKRKKFALREITALYEFSQKTGQPPQYFTSSYAGAIGWGQFIPSSLLAFFIDANGVDEDTDPFSIEDTIFSVENYLYEHNLSGENIDNYDSRYTSVFAYNHSDIYVKAVLLIYDGLRDHFRPVEQSISAYP